MGVKKVQIFQIPATKKLGQLADLGKKIQIQLLFLPSPRRKRRRDISAAINIKRVGLDEFPTIKRRKGKPVIVDSNTDLISKEVLSVFRRRRSCPHRTLLGSVSGVVTIGN